MMRICHCLEWSLFSWVLTVLISHIHGCHYFESTTLCLHGLHYYYRDYNEGECLEEAQRNGTFFFFISQRISIPSPALARTFWRIKNTCHDCSLSWFQDVIVQGCIFRVIFLFSSNILLTYLALNNKCLIPFLLQLLLEADLILHLQQCTTLLIPVCWLLNTVHLVSATFTIDKLDLRWVEFVILEV